MFELAQGFDLRSIPVVRFVFWLRGKLMGAVAQPWKADVEFKALPPDRFAAFSEPDLVKIVWTLEAEPLAPCLTRLRTQTRAGATSDGAGRKFRLY